MEREGNKTKVIVLPPYGLAAWPMHYASQMKAGLGADIG